MKGLFFINFMVILSCFSVAAGVLYNYIVQGGQGKKIALLTACCSALGAGELYWYSHWFPGLTGGIRLMGLHIGALASVSWFLTFLLAFPVLAVLAAGIFFYRLKRRGRPVAPAENMTAGEHQGPSMSRRTFLKGMAAAVPVAAAATSGLGNVVGESYLAVTKLPLSFPNLPDYLEGYRIGQISDSHIGLFFSPEDLKTAMERLAAEKVNRLEITGDLIDELSRLPQCRQVLMEGAALFPDGIDFCYGNHEYYRGLADITDMLESTPIRIVRNSHFCASPGGGRNLSGRSGRDNRPFYIAGTDFSFAPSGRLHDEQRRDYTQTALQGIPEGAFTILLAHNSAFIDEGFAHHIPLTMCGHTHGAQFAPIGPLVQAVGFKYLRGLFQKDGCYGYVNRGTGHWLPFRVLCSREVTVYELQKKR